MTAPHDTGALVGPPPRMVLDAVEQSVKEARDFAKEYIEFHQIRSDLCDDVLLVVSEVVTNAIRYGTEPGDSVLVELGHGPDNVSIEVHDTRRAEPRFRPESVERQRGRGMFIVDALATWGVRDRPFGKIVWAEVKAS
ncbi:ATP-binding protein [Streptomyces marianii]|uniref:ATP-binding protein n=1 Tax=Streptomyces marianii TaxID=1817406 RepID=A0A5R9DS96_9ACTN|nr:ATP-binding protein [Streptomyces marianii]TLQ38856.1 ATP-binding protein [Streptomyces marianii]